MEQKKSVSAYNFADHVIKCQREQGSVLICGLDPQLQKIPNFLFFKHRHLETTKMIGAVISEFNKRIIDAVQPYVCGFKPQVAFYERFGHEGWNALQWTSQWVQDTGLIDLWDAKRGDGGDTASAYADLLVGYEYPDFIDDQLVWGVYSRSNVDCMTVHGWIDEAQMQPMLAKIKPAGKGLQVVCKTSFTPESRIEEIVARDHSKVWQHLALNVHFWSEGTEGKEGYKTIGVVLGATRSEDADTMRRMLPKNLFLIPGYGAQAGDADGAVRSFNKDGFGGMVNSSRAILYAYCNKKGQFQCNEEDFAKAAALEAERSRNELNEALNKKVNLQEI